MTTVGGVPAARRAPVFAPDDADAALARFVLADDEGGVRHLHRWHELVELDDASSASHHLLPSAYLRIEAVAPQDPDLGRLRGIYRQRWAAGQQHVAATDGVARVLGSSGIRFMRPPDQHAQRSVVEPLVLPLITPRITVPEEESAAALGALFDAGWRHHRGDAHPSLRARLIQTEWELELEAQRGQRVVVALDFNAVIGDRDHRSRTWERTAAANGEGPNGQSSEFEPSPTDLFLALLSEAPRDAGALRWAIGALAVARQSTTFQHVEAIVAHPSHGYLLGCLESRLEFLASVDPNVESIGRALDVVRAARQARDASPATTRGAISRQWAHRTRQLQVLSASIRRHGGLGKTARHLFDTRR